MHLKIFLFVFLKTPLSCVFLLALSSFMYSYSCRYVNIILKIYTFSPSNLSFTPLSLPLL